MQIKLLGMMLWINYQWAGVAVMNPYRSWAIAYSHGKQFNWDKKGWVNLWHWPTLNHCDTRQILKEANLPKGESK